MLLLLQDSNPRKFPSKPYPDHMGTVDDAQMRLDRVDIPRPAVHRALSTMSP